MQPVPTERVRGWRAILAGLALALGMLAAPAAFAQNCTWDFSAADNASFGTINPTSTTTATFTVTIRYGCNGGASPSFSITGLNDSGPGNFRLKHATLAQFMPYNVTTTIITTGTARVRFDGTLIAANYQNAWVGAYSDTLTVLIAP